MAKNVIAVLEAASVSFGVLGNEEECDGNEAYMLGELGLLQELASRNTKKFEELGGQEGTDGLPSCLQLDEEVPGEEL
jgi:Fe-S oxidoreductase